MCMFSLMSIDKIVKSIEIRTIVITSLVRTLSRAVFPLILFLIICLYYSMRTENMIFFGINEVTQPNLS